MHRSVHFLLRSPLARTIQCQSVRNFTATTALRDGRVIEQSGTEGDPTIERRGWFGKLFKAGSSDDKSVGSHSATLAETHHVYEMQIHKVKPRFLEEYLAQYSSFISLMKSKDIGAKLVGSWTVEIGDQGEAIHIWSYRDYKVLHEKMYKYWLDEDFMEYRKARNRMIDGRRNVIMMKFSFWNDPTPRSLFGDTPSIYELRTYSLRPGNLIEWGNLWARGIKFRQLNDEAVCGWFVQMGRLHTVHHLWNYKDLQSRKETREAAWRNPGWDENVSYTVPLIRKMRSRILIPTPFSPLQ